jgi:hypothetical protein
MSALANALLRELDHDAADVLADRFARFPPPAQMLEVV